MSVKDISFLEYEYLKFLVMNYFIGEHIVEINGEYYNYQPKNRITLFSEVEGEKIDIGSSDLINCKEMYISFKNTKIIKQLELSMYSKNINISFTLKTSPLRVTSVVAPKSIAEDINDKVIERLLYFDTVKKFFDSTFKSFIDVRISDGWNVM
ncbi:MAG: hypothetical protein K6348_09640, partial [Deferribacterales bacterium]